MNLKKIPLELKNTFLLLFWFIFYYFNEIDFVKSKGRDYKRLNNFKSFKFFKSFKATTLLVIFKDFFQVIFIIVILVALTRIINFKNRVLKVIPFLSMHDEWTSFENLLNVTKKRLSWSNILTKLHRSSS